MQLEDLQQQWRRLEHKLDQSLALETEMVRQSILQVAHSRIDRLAIWPTIDTIFSILVLLLGMTFLSIYGGTWQLAWPACVVLLGAFVLLITSIRQLQRVVELDWEGPLVVIQQSLEALRISKIRQFKWIILLSPLVGFCGFITGLFWLLDWLTQGRVNILDKINPWWILSNYAFGLLFIPLGYFVARLLAPKCYRHRWWQAVLDDISGKSLKDAMRNVQRWAELLQAPGHQN